MRHRIFIFFALIILSGSAFSQTQSLRVSLLTQDPGEELYAFFGHTAIRITDDSLGIDQVYNYGTFDFSTKNFYLRFIKGDLDYCLSIDYYGYFVDFSKETNRTITEQVLDLSYEEKVNLLTALETCYNTPARYYRYDFLKNNCATKIRDIIEDATAKRIDFDKANYSGMTFRQLLRPYISSNYWLNLGMNLVMGSATDEAAKPEDYMFLPFYIQEFFANTKFVTQSTVILDASPKQKTGFNFSYLAPWIIVVILLTMSFWKKSRKIALYSLSTVFSLMGLLILAFGIYSKHPALGQNMNIIWTIPALLILIVRKKSIAEIIKMVYVAIIALLLATWTFLPQELSLTFLPWMFCMMIMLLLNLNVVELVKKKIKKSKAIN